MRFLCVSEGLETCCYVMFPDQSVTGKRFRSIEYIAGYLRVRKHDYIDILQVVLFLKHAGSGFSANGSERVLMLYM